jgi:alkylmercury lyase
MPSLRPDREKIVATIINSFPREFTNLSREEQQVSVQLYRLLAVGEPVSRQKVAQSLKLSEDAVNQILDRWPGVYFDEGDRIIGYWGLALPKMAHRFAVNGQTLYTWCAWDGLFLPQILESTARVESRCPVTGEAIRLTVTPEGVRQLDPPGAVMSFVTPDQAKVRENVILNFCHYVYFFASTRAGSRWISENPGTFLLTLDDAYYLGRKKNSVQYKEILDAGGGWRQE